MQKEQLEAMSDFDLNCLIVDKLEIISDVHFSSAITRHVKDGEVLRCAETLDYCNNPSDMMPLVFEKGISLVYMDEEYEAHSLCCGDEVNNTLHKNPLRAAAIVYLLIKGEK